MFLSRVRLELDVGLGQECQHVDRVAEVHLDPARRWRRVVENNPTWAGGNLGQRVQSQQAKLLIFNSWTQYNEIFKEHLRYANHLCTQEIALLKLYGLQKRIKFTDQFSLKPFHLKLRKNYHLNKAIFPLI